MQGYESLEQVKQKGLTPLSVDEVKHLLNENILILDSRHAAVFSKGFIPTSIFIGLEGRFAEWQAAFCHLISPWCW